MSLSALVLSQSQATAVVNAMTTNLGTNAGIKVYTGAPPAGPDSAETGTLTVSGTVSSWGAPAYTAGVSGMASSATMSASGYSPAASGISTHAMIITSGGTQEQMALVGSPWIASQQTALNQLCYANGNTYQCTTAGISSTTAPSGTTTFNDGTAVWTYQGAGKLYPVELGNVLVTLGTQVQMSMQQICPSQSV